MSEFSALQVVNWFRAQNVADMKTDEMVEPLTQMKAMKLLYYAQGIMLAAYDRKLFSENILAWKYGPVVDTVHRHYIGQRSITSLDEDSKKMLSPEEIRDFEIVNSDSDANLVLTTVCEEYGDKSAIELMNMTHEELPWQSTTQSEIIETDLIKKYFKENILA
ncbi:DUF4065 domain-containing protein [Leuconostoc falkenbergense]|mgnify:FL=1|uniref:Panacea domain-containing protein n=1 Tax=Leuconostoc falkenbergense TaxID=2766470 RepID=UPI002A82686B|nr:type II toxin-antitoxin system antitoxin SocA domain-containing protein [Leuconostoc falkenbergense]MDY5164171.1 DUF4065 domain-containing protein [Leuconostoc falkenbergense]